MVVLAYLTNCAKKDFGARVAETGPFLADGFAPAASRLRAIGGPPTRPAASLALRPQRWFQDRSRGGKPADDMAVEAAGAVLPRGDCKYNLHSKKGLVIGPAQKTSIRRIHTEFVQARRPVRGGGSAPCPKGGCQDNLHSQKFRVIGQILKRAFVEFTRNKC
jgi:hypothetical protein